MADKKYLVNGVEKAREELFNEQELAVIDRNQQLFNDAGYGDIDITLLTHIEREISQQKFYKVDPEKTSTHCAFTSLTATTLYRVRQSMV